MRGSVAMMSPAVQENTADNSTVVPLSQEEKKQTKKRKQPKKRVQKRKRREDDQEEDEIRAGASGDCAVIASDCTIIATTAIDCTIVDILAAEGHVKTMEKRKSMISHFDFFLQLRL